ncbi:hypothetical protein BH10ACI3_BH10ACI3_26690 [soil metagenome]
MPVLWPMSKKSSSYLIVFAAFGLILQFFTNVRSQDIAATVTVNIEKPNLVRVEGRFISGLEPVRKRNLSFLRDYAGISNIGERVSDVSVLAADGSPVNSRRMIAGEYLADSDFTAWAYSVNLTPLKDPTASGHLSWLTPDRGILFLADLLPQTSGTSAARVMLRLKQSGTPADPRVDDDNTFEYKDKDKAVIYLGSKLRGTTVFSGKTKLTFSIAGDWKFTDEAASKMVLETFANYDRTFGSSSADSVKIHIEPYPIPVSTGNYEADTRGANITIISSDMPFKSQSLQRLHEQLRHELFHLWIPNGVNLTGNYDWFYEGFALYQSLKTGVAVNQIRFDDLLDTLSRAYDIDSMQTPRVSLIDASKNRWNGANTQVYARGMLVAFLCDLTMLERSKGKRSVSDLVREVYARHRFPNSAVDGNDAVVAIMRTQPGLGGIIDRSIIGQDDLDWAAALKYAGLAAENKDQVTKLVVTAKPTGRQKDLLDKLGYNNWRKLSSGH